MGKIYCLTGQSRELRESVYKALLDWSEKRGEISFSLIDPEETYNLYVNDYLINADWEEYKQLTEQFDDDILIPVYIGSDEGDTGLREFGVFKTYNVPYDDTGFNQGVKEILSSEFAYYKDDYNFREEEIIDEAVVGEDGPGDAPSETGSKKNSLKFKDKLINIGKVIIRFLKKRKKFELAGMAISLCIILGFVTTLSILASRPDPFYTKNGNFDIFTNMGDSTYVCSSNGDLYSFDGYSNCSINKTIDGKNAVLTTDYDELYYLTEGDASKIADDIYISYISNKGEYIYYITRPESYFILSRYETKNGETIDLDYIKLSGEAEYCDMTASPDGKMLALNLYFDSLTDYCVVYDFDGGKTSLEEVDSIYAITDKGDVYLKDTYGKFIFTKKDGDKYTGRDISRSNVSTLYFNSDYSEVICAEYNIINDTYETGYCIFTEKMGTISLSVEWFLENYERSNWRIKETASTVNRWGGGSYIYDIDSLRDMHFVSNDNNIYKLNNDYTLKFIYGNAGGYDKSYSISRNGKFIICQTENKIFAVDNNGSSSVLLDIDQNLNIDNISTTNNKSIYYFDRTDNYLYYRKSGREKKICRFPDGDMVSSSQYAVDTEKDIIYFIVNDRLYYSKEGGSMVEIKTDSTSPDDIKRISFNDSGIYYFSYNSTNVKYDNYEMQDGTYLINYKIYSMTDSHELKFLFEIENRGRGSVYGEIY